MRAGGVAAGVHVDHEFWVERDAVLGEGVDVAGHSPGLSDHIVHGAHVGDAGAAGVDEMACGLESNAVLVGHDAGRYFGGIGRIGEHHFAALQRLRQHRLLVKHACVDEAVHAELPQRENFAIGAFGSAVDAHGEQQISECAGGVLRALNHAAGKRRGGHFVAEESDGAATAGA